MKKIDTSNATSLIEIGVGAFGGTSNLSNFIVPATVTKIGYGAFENMGLYCNQSDMSLKIEQNYNNGKNPIAANANWGFKYPIKVEWLDKPLIK